MEYYPSASLQSQEFLFARKKTALLRLKKLGLTLPYISDSLSYEQLLANYTVLDISNLETNYLKQGIEELLFCLKSVQSHPVISREDVEKEVFKMRGGNLDKVIMEGGENSQNIRAWVDYQVTTTIDSDIKSKQITEEVLIREISEFKIRLGRVNIIVKIENDLLEFKETNKMTELYIYEKEILENPHPKIFKDIDAFILFERLHSIFKHTNKQRADYGFIYWKMWEDGFILKEFKPEKFRKWIGEEEYKITTSSAFRTLQGCTTQLKEDLYTTLKTIG